TIAGQIELSAELIGEIRLAVAIRIAPDRPNHRRPWPFDDEDAAMTVRDFMARFIDDRRHDSGKLHRARAGYRGRYARQRRDQMPAGFRLPPGIDDRAAATTDIGVVPHPRFRIDRLADGAEQTEARKIVIFRRRGGIGLGCLDERTD